MRNYPGMSEPQRKDVVGALAKVLADTSVLYFKTHGFHWNVEGPRFLGLHTLFETHYRDMWNAIDIIAERIRALGMPAPGSYGQLMELSCLEEQRAIPSADDMLRELTEGHEAVMLTLRNALATAQDAGDEATAGVLATRLEAHEKAAWMLSSLVAQR
jgi:starvation-inducible DNA-binding protein